MTENIKLQLSSYGELMQSLPEEAQKIIYEYNAKMMVIALTLEKEPIIEYKSQAELDSSLAEWQERLLLTDWIIRARFDDTIHAYAEVAKVTDVQSAVISIHPLDEVTEGRNTKYCAEKSLVHELLHLKFDLVDFDNPPIEAAVFSYTQHQKIEQMSKSLIMAKYGIGFDWFKNF
jgi:hypothetical protein